MTCPRCGHAFQPGARFCAGCGLDTATLSSSPGAAPAGPAGTGTPPQYQGPSTHPGPTYPGLQQQPYPQQPYSQQPYSQQPYPQPGFPGQAGSPGQPGYEATAPFGAQPYPGQQPPPAQPRRKKKWLLPAIGAGALVVAGGVTAGIVLLSSSGAGSPQEAVGNLATAVSDEDPVGAVATLEPSEFSELSDVFSKAADKAHSLGYAKDSSSNSFLSGLNVDVANLQTNVQLLSPHVARVQITSGMLAWKINTADMSDSLRRSIEHSNGGHALDSNGTVDLGQLIADNNGRKITPFLMVVDKGDGWYVSPLFTTAEYVVELGNLPGGNWSKIDPDAPNTAGATTPDGVVSNLLNILRSGGGEAALREVCNEAGGVFAVYQDAIVSQLENAVPDITSFSGDLRASTQVRPVDDTHAEVVLGSLTGTASTSNDSWNVNFNGACPTGRSDCFGQFGTLLKINDLHVLVTQRDGRWGIDPLGTLWNYAGHVVDGVDQNSVYHYLRTAHLEETATPTGRLAYDGVTDVTLNQAGFAVYTLDVQAGQVFTAGSSDAGVQITGDVSYPDSLGSAVKANSTGTLTVVVENGSASNGGGGTASVAVRSLATADAALDTPTNGSLASWQCAQYVVAAGSADYVALDVTSASSDLSWGALEYSSVTSTTSGGQVYEISGAGSFPMEICNNGGNDLAYLFTASVYQQPLGPSVDGAASVSGYVSYGSSTTHSVYVPASTPVHIVVTPAADLDVKVDVQLSDGSHTYDGGYEGYPESFTIYGGGTAGYVTITVSVYSSSSSSSGNYTVSVS